MYYIHSFYDIVYYIPIIYDLTFVYISIFMFLLLLSTVKSSRHFFFTLFDDRVYCLLCHNVWTKGSTHSCELPMTHEDNFKKAFLEKNSSRYRKNFIVIFTALYSPIAIISMLSNYCLHFMFLNFCLWTAVYEFLFYQGKQ